MEKVLRGIMGFRHTKRAHLIGEFEKIRNNPRPSILMFTCMDSRMLPTRITQAKVGEIFVVRSAGNLIPHVQVYGPTGSDVSVSTEPVAMELAVKRGGIEHVVVLGHSDCKAMNILYDLHQHPDTFEINSAMDQWLRRNGIRSIKRLNEALQFVGKSPVKFHSRTHSQFCFDAYIDPLNKLAVQDKLSQVNVLQQLVNLSKHSVLWPYIESRRLFAHAMWFDVYTGELFLFSRKRKIFVKLDEFNVPILLDEMEEFESPTKTDDTVTEEKS
ncbi:hypothetical protein M3Y94_00819200 [Aphelenchoides besseyi]|nr:hypothetical protein M3Y94_00819200 [Aphelenchoides besseyi]KAI6227136.1 Beta carbonic anhydrase 1 [Aphelenchoides besseyi]